jgi:hypothetical protein
VRGGVAWPWVAFALLSLTKEGLQQRLATNAELPAKMQRSPGPCFPSRRIAEPRVPIAITAMAGEVVQLRTQRDP